jgi:hypothetical protein
MAQQMHTPTGASARPVGADAGYGASYGAAEGRGWLTFAAVMFFAAGALDALWGISALVNDDYFAADELLFGDLSMWGAIYIAFGALQIITGLLILSRSAVGAVLGIGLTLLHAIAVLMSIGAYPVWSIILLAIDGLIVYGLTVYGFDESEV